ncbi:reactive intermediate/imine deaminase [Coxiella burnetii]|nr:reactive intermediate/imine deaminase [Coxiella burnetii]AML55603.1 reactive intermediate/imine deaminase [Coxiella burnetii]ATN69585.1 reactive intermediate/imine deaminase [Coxiella burnetii]ATN71507.1 reactive intermediate/imine deaminase [Coxiella burnetii]ATN73398.1 reactive intermediate/imine deaminase [Coxiella burnetii]
MRILRGGPKLIFYNTSNWGVVMKQIIGTNKAPRAIGTYSQAVKAGNTVYFSGQIPLEPETMEIISGDFKDHVHRVFKNIAAIAEAAGGSLAQIVKLTIYLIDMENFHLVNEVMKHYYEEPYPARAVIAVKQLPKNALIEIDAVMVLGE